MFIYDYTRPQLKAHPVAFSIVGLIYDLACWAILNIPTALGWLDYYLLGVEARAIKLWGRLAAIKIEIDITMPVMELPKYRLSIFNPYTYLCPKFLMIA